MSLSQYLANFFGILQGNARLFKPQPCLPIPFLRFFLTQSLCCPSVCLYLQGDGSLLDTALLAITSPGAPFLVHARSSTQTSLTLSSLVNTGAAAYNQIRRQAPDFTEEVVEEAWR